MIPIRRAGEKTVAWTSRILLLVNGIAFLAQLLLGANSEAYIARLGFIPLRFFWSFSNHEIITAGLLPLITSVLLHGGPIHLIGNMIYLFVFGSEVETRFGPARFLAFYFAAGAVGSIAHGFVFPESTIPSIGASGCIAGILGAFLVLSPLSRIVTLIPLLISWIVLELPALVFLPIWLSMQFMNGFFALEAARNTQEVAGVAWWSHVGGFVFGALVAGLWRLAQRGVSRFPKDGEPAEAGR